MVVKLNNLDKPRIVHVITGMEAGGAERMLARICCASTSFTHEVVVLAKCGTMGRQLREKGIRVHALGASRRRDGLGAVADLWRYLRSDPPALLQSWLIHANLAAYLAAPRQIPLIWSVRHTLDGFDEERWTTRAAVRFSAVAARRARRIVYNSVRAAEQHEAVGYPRATRMLIANGFDLGDADEARTLRTATRRELGIKTGDRLLGLIARAHPIKNHAAFLEACYSLRSAHPEMRILLVGKGTEADSKLAGRFAESFGDRILWLGERDDVLRLTAALDIAANVSLGEAFSNTVGEAMSCGVACVVTDVGESVRIVGTTGWVCERSDAAAIERALESALSCSAHEIAARGRAAKARISEKFCLPLAIEAYEALYHELCSGASAQLKNEDFTNKCVV